MRKRAFDDQKHFVFGFVVVPGKRTLKLHELQVLPVQLTDDARVPMVID